MPDPFSPESLKRTLSEVCQFVGSGLSFTDALAITNARHGTDFTETLFNVTFPSWREQVVAQAATVSTSAESTSPTQAVADLAVRLKRILDNFEGDENLMKYIPSLSQSYIKSLEFIDRTKKSVDRAPDAEVFAGKLRELDSLSEAGFVEWKNRDGFVNAFGNKSN